MTTHTCVEAVPRVGAPPPTRQTARVSAAGWGRWLSSTGDEILGSASAGRRARIAELEEALVVEWKRDDALRSKILTEKQASPRSPRDQPQDVQDGIPRTGDCLHKGGDCPESAVRGGTLSERLAATEPWAPPPLRALPNGGTGFFSAWSHLGALDRFELVKSVNRSRDCRGGPLSDACLEWAVLCLEQAESEAATANFAPAATLLERVLDWCPSVTVAYYRLALALLAARGLPAAGQASALLRCSLGLEPDSPHLAANADLVLRLISNVDIPEEYWSEAYPRSMGDLRCLEAAVVHAHTLP